MSAVNSCDTAIVSVALLPELAKTHSRTLGIGQRVEPCPSAR